MKPSIQLKTMQFALVNRNYEFHTRISKFSELYKLQLVETCLKQNQETDNERTHHITMS